MNLSEDEKAEIKRLIDAGRPLPDKYRWRLFEMPRETELIWPGKTSEVTNVVLPFQTIEQIDEPRAEASGSFGDLFSVSAGGRQSGGWSNKLIWGDNKLVLASLKNGPLRRQIEDAGGLKLVYIDPPFDVGADFSFEIEVGDGSTLRKDLNIVEDIAYRDTWGRGVDSYISMLYERCALIHDLISPNGSVYVQVGPQINHHVRMTLDEIFGSDHSLREIIWKRVSSRNHGNYYPATHDAILFYADPSAIIWE